MDKVTTAARNLVRIALWLLGQGFHLIPVHGVVQGSCTCGNLTCRSAGKHPCTRHGSKNATTDRTQVEHWFNQDFPDGNVGIATGEGAGVIVLDVDPRHGGENSLVALETAHAELPVTPTSKTGGGGLHFFFKHPGGTIKNSAGAIGPGIDVRGEAGFVVAPPSIHASGCHYEWLPGRSPDQVPLVPPPPWLLDAMRGSRPAGPGARTSGKATLARLRELIRDGAKEGERNDAITRVFGYLLNRKVDVPIAVDLTLAWNQARSSPPLTDSEAMGALESIAGAELRQRKGGEPR